jgi:biopolymer transport protein ExbB
MLREFTEITGLWSALHAFHVYLTLGGFVMWAILAVAVVLGWALGTRFALLRRGSDKNVRVLLRRAEEGRSNPPNGVVDVAIQRGLALKRAGKANLRRHLDEAFFDLESDLRRHAILVTTLVLIAPLLGLLGTVSGMIVTFESLADMALFTQDGGIAAGISTALFTTQMGLVVAVPGMIAKGVLDRRQNQLSMDLDQLKDILTCSPSLTETNT